MPLTAQFRRGEKHGCGNDFLTADHVCAAHLTDDRHEDVLTMVWSTNSAIA